MTKRERAGVLWMLLAAVGFAFNPTVVKTVYSHSTLEPLDLAIWRLSLAAPLMWILLRLRDRARGPSHGSGINVADALMVGAVTAAAVAAAFFALERLPGSVYVVLFYTYPAMVVVASFVLGEKVGGKAWIALLMALFGVSLTVPDFLSAGNKDLLGVGLALLNAALVAIYYLLAKRVLSQAEDITRASAHMTSGTLLILLLLLPLRGLQMPDNLTTALGILIVASLGTALPIFATNMAIQRIGAARASLVSVIEPVLSMLLSMILLNEVIQGLQWLGAALIVGSVIVLQMRVRGRVDVSIAHEAG